MVVTLGADGLLAVTGEGTWHARPEPVDGNPTGAGDAAAAGAGTRPGARPVLARPLRHAAALGAAAVAAPVAGEFALPTIERALASVAVSQLGAV